MNVITTAKTCVGYDNKTHSTTPVTNFRQLDGHGGLPFIILGALAGQVYRFEIDAPSTPTDKGVTLGASANLHPTQCCMLISEDANDDLADAATVVPGSFGARWKTQGGRFRAAHLCTHGVPSYLFVSPVSDGDIALEVH